MTALLIATGLQPAKGHEPAGETASLDQQLRAEGTTALAAAALAEGDAARGAIVFHQPYLACAKCHQIGHALSLGPDLTRLDPKTTAEQLVESILEPSTVIRKGFEPLTVLTHDGRRATGLFVEETPGKLVLRDPSDGRLLVFPTAEIEERVRSQTSIMPTGQANQLAGRQQFLDLIRYLVEIAAGGPARAAQLQPPASLLVLKLPEYEEHLDHHGLIRDLEQPAVADEAFRRGKALYQRVCVNCHGTHDQPGSLPTSLRFAAGKFKNGTDPLSIYRTLTQGFGMMAAQTWMVPQQKYDVIHYIREAYLKDHNPSQYFPLGTTYLAGLPHGDTRGPEPLTLEPWVTMDYGPSLINTYEAGTEGTNIAQKGIAVRLDSGPGGVSRGNAWMVFDHDTLRVAAAWTGNGFVDWNGIHFNGAHQVHPRLVGDVVFSNPTGPGWADPETGSLLDDQRVLGRDGKRYGPLPKKWGRYRGLYQHANRAVISYQVGETDVLELPRVATVAREAGGTVVAAGTSVALPHNATDASVSPIFIRNLQLGPRNRDLLLVVATHSDESAELQPSGKAVSFGPAGDDASPSTRLLAGLLVPSPACTWTQEGPRLCLRIAAGNEPERIALWTTRADPRTSLDRIEAAVMADAPPLDLKELMDGGPPRWPQRLITIPQRGGDGGPFAVDVLTPPDNNPWLAQVRLTGLDFFPDGDRAVLCAWDGDVWLVTGLSQLDRAEAGAGVQPQPTLNWQRIASGLFQPLGIKIVDERIFVTCRDQLVILRDRNGDGETDFYECFNNDHQVTEHFHEFAMGLQVDQAGNFYYAKSARHALPALVPHHGTLLRVSPDGERTDILAVGFRAANGVCLNPDGSFVVTDQEGHWNPKNRINWVTADSEGSPRFYGNMFGYHSVTDEADDAMEPPLCWITNAFDRSPAELLWVTSERWQPLQGSLLNLSYGYGKVYIVPHERVRGRLQGGMCELPIPAFPTGVMRGRFHPVDGQLYVCGMFAWAGSATQPGGFYRIRRTAHPVTVPVGIHARTGELELRFSSPLDASQELPLDKFSIRVWALHRTANYGSDHFNEHPLAIQTARIGPDRHTVVLDVPELSPTWCMEIKYALRTASSEIVEGVLHNTLHELAD